MKTTGGLISFLKALKAPFLKFIVQPKVQHANTLYSENYLNEILVSSQTCTDTSVALLLVNKLIQKE